MLTSKQRAYLKSLASTEDTILIIGKGGITEDVIKQAVDALAKRELIKAKVLETSEESLTDVAVNMAQKTDSQLVQTIGRKFVLYKKKKKDSKIDIDKIK